MVKQKFKYISRSHRVTGKMTDIVDLVLEASVNVPDKGIYKVTQFLHDLVYNSLPESYQNLPAAVAVEGFLGAFLLATGFQLASKHIIDKKINGFYDKWLPKLEQGCILGIPAALLAYMVLDEEGAKYWIHGKPMDNLGIFAAYLGGLAAAVPDLVKRSKKKLLEKITKEYPK